MRRRRQDFSGYFQAGSASTDCSGDRPRLLAGLADSYGYGVVLIDKQGARLFYSPARPA